MNAIRTPLRAIRAKCVDCCCGQLLEVRLCPSENCPLWPYRMGKRPKIPADGETSENSKITAAISAQRETETV